MQCKKEKEVICREERIVTELVVQEKYSEYVVLPYSNDTVKYEYMFTDESRCSNWYWDQEDNCNYRFGQARLEGYLSLNSDTTFRFKPYIGGCHFERNGPQINMFYNDIYVLLNKVEPYPKDYNNIDFLEYKATFKIFQTVTICD